MINLYLGGAGDSSDKLSKMIGSQFSKTNNFRELMINYIIELQDLATFKDEEPEQNVNDLFRGVSEEKSVQKVLRKIDSTASVGSIGKKLVSGEMKWSDVPYISFCWFFGK